jgi:predicted metal-binding membrane protein
MPGSSSALETVLKRDRTVVVAALVLITALSWLYLVDMARDMAAMDMSMPEPSAVEPSAAGEAMTMPADADGASGGMTMDAAMDMTAIESWTPTYFVAMFLMWAIMMVGMMVPSAAPMILTYAALARQKDGSQSPLVSTGAFTGGYLLAWTAFSLVATLLQWGLSSLALLSPMLVSTSPYLGGGILIVAGLYQLTPYKNACLVHCRHPVQYFMAHWQKGRAGALRMGLHHGIYCVGCCWFLMMLLFFGGVMNLVWIAAITVFVLLEKVIPRGELAGLLTGIVMIVTGLAVTLLSL